MQEVVRHLWPWWPLWLPLGMTRLTQVAMFDRLLDAPRNWWLKRINPNNYPKGDDRLSLLAYLTMCIFCMSLDLCLIVMALMIVPILGDIVVLVVVAAFAAFLVPIIDHWGDKLLADKPFITDTEREVWDTGPSLLEQVEADAATAEAD